MDRNQKEVLLRYLLDPALAKAAKEDLNCLEDVSIVEIGNFIFRAQQAVGGSCMSQDFEDLKRKVVALKEKAINEGWNVEETLSQVEDWLHGK